MWKTNHQGRWTLEVDADATRGAMAHPDFPPGAEGCGCACCLNFVAQRESAYPPALLQLFDALGVDHRAEIEVVDHGPAAGGKRHYGAWFHVVGRILEGADARVALVDVDTPLGAGARCRVPRWRRPVHRPRPGSVPGSPEPARPEGRSPASFACYAHSWPRVPNSSSTTASSYTPRPSASIATARPGSQGALSPCPTRSCPPVARAAR
jgi:hypothetical protein